MGKGRKALPDSIKALKGNPGKRRLNFLDQAERAGNWVNNVSVPVMPAAKIPNFLTDEKEREAFRTVVDDYLQRRVARTSDLSAYGRWAFYLVKWIFCKEKLGHDRELFIIGQDKTFKRNPYFRDMIDLERMMEALEDRLGLNPIARQNIIRGLSAMPSALSGMYDEDQQREAQEQGDKPKAVKQEELSPLGFLSAAGKPH